MRGVAGSNAQDIFFMSCILSEFSHAFTLRSFSLSSQSLFMCQLWHLSILGDQQTNNRFKKKNLDPHYLMKTGDRKQLQSPAKLMHKLRSLCGHSHFLISNNFSLTISWFLSAQPAPGSPQSWDSCCHHRAAVFAAWSNGSRVWKMVSSPTKNKFGRSWEHQFVMCRTAATPTNETWKFDIAVYMKVLEQANRHLTEGLWTSATTGSVASTASSLGNLPAATRAYLASGNPANHSSKRTSKILFWVVLLFDSIPKQHKTTTSGVHIFQRGKLVQTWSSAVSSGAWRVETNQGKIVFDSSLGLPGILGSGWWTHCLSLFWESVASMLEATATPALFATCVTPVASVSSCFSFFFRIAPVMSCSSLFMSCSFESINLKKRHW